MPLESDLKLDPHLFAPDAVPPDVQAMNENLIKMGQETPPWYEVGAAKYREMRATGQTSFPKTIRLSEGRDTKIPSRESGREIPVRIFGEGKRGANANANAKKDGGGGGGGVLLYIHGGGFVLQSEGGQDPLLRDLAEGGDLVVFSVGYRLAPEYPYPAGPEDCYDAVTWLVNNAEKTFGSTLKFISGESAGGWLTLKTFLFILHTHPSTKLAGLMLGYGLYDPSLLPSALTSPKPLMLNTPGIQHFADAFLPNNPTTDERRNADISLLHVDWKALRGKLPPALFMVGTEDPLFDDTVLMSVRWIAGGGETVLKVVPGAPHAFVLFDREKVSVAKTGVGYMVEFLRERGSGVGHGLVAR